MQCRFFHLYGLTSSRLVYLANRCLTISELLQLFRFASFAMLALISGVTLQMIVSTWTRVLVGFIEVLLIRSRQQVAVASSITQ
jgi:hypothetical protein